MSVNVARLPQRVEGELESVNLEFHARDVAKALSGSDVLQRHGPSGYPNWYQCCCPLCGGGLRIANPATDDKIMVDCAQGRAPTRVVAEQVRLGHMLCKSGWLRP
jgi:hypothetical protein